MWTYYTPVEPMNPAYYQARARAGVGQTPPITVVEPPVCVCDVRQNITTVRLPFLLFDLLGLGFLALPDFWKHHNNPESLMFVTQSVGDALWGAPDGMIAALLQDLQEFLNIAHINITIPINQFDQAPGEGLPPCSVCLNV